MGKLTYVISNSRRAAIVKSRLVLDGTTVHASHPENPDRLVPFPNATDKEALATFQKVIQKYFHPRDGWVLEEKRPGVADLSSWAPPPPSPEEVAKAAEATKRKQMGWAIEGEILLVELARQKNVNDLEIALDKGAGCTALHVITSVADMNGGSTGALMGFLTEGAMPRLTSLSLDCPWETLTRTSSYPVPGIAPLLEKRTTFEKVAIVGANLRWPRKCKQPKLHTVRLLDQMLEASVVEGIAAMHAPALKNVHLGFTVEGAVDPTAEAAVTRLPLGQLDELVLEGLSDAPAMIARLISGPPKARPKRVCVDGSVRDDEELVASAQKFAKAAAESQLRIGENIGKTISEETQQTLAAIVGEETYTSPFDVSNHDPRVRELWSIFA